ncbi:receptor-like serine/threonine-protein kinase SD1-8 isoform X2 [Daucus carota subsp. sativus]|uniref:receptor-like serine/threonine-protein kinase SD1-8 isoform X2 n=1 Tax=Daucus carota subsp. sativus TaxID=79200 RepID=UPI003083C41F
MKRFPAIVFLSCVATICSALDTMTSTQILKDRVTIFSSARIFDLGIFGQGDSKSPYSASHGCVMEKPLMCEKGDGFYKFSSVKVPDINSSKFNDSIRLPDCKTVCLANCSCMAFTILDIKGDEKECLQWYGSFFDIQQLPRGDQDLYVRVSFSESDQAKRKDRSKLLMMLTMLVALVLLVQILGFCIWKKRKHILLMRFEGSLERKFTEFNSKRHKEDVEKPLLPLTIPAAASNDLTISNKLRKVEVGEVFKTDVASVLSETIVHIKFLHEQVSILTNAAMESGASIRPQNCDNSKDSQGQKQDLRSRGLCLVPVSSTHKTTIASWDPSLHSEELMMNFINQYD